MSLETIPAIYESGVFKPLQPVNLLEHRRIKLIIETEEFFHPSSYLTTEEILTLANKRSTELLKKPREVVIKQHQKLIKTLQIEAIRKRVKVDDYPDGD